MVQAAPRGFMATSNFGSACQSYSLEAHVTGGVSDMDLDSTSSVALLVVRSNCGKHASITVHSKPCESWPHQSTMAESCRSHCDTFCASLLIGCGQGANVLDARQASARPAHFLSRAGESEALCSYAGFIDLKA